MKTTLLRTFGAIIIGTTLVGCSQIDAGWRGVKTTWGKASNDIYEPGLHFVEVFSQSMTKYDCREQREDYRMQSYTKDVQSADFLFTVTYSLDPNSVVDIHNRYGHDYANKILNPVVFGVVKDVVGHWEADKLVNGRDQATKEIYTLLMQKMDNTPIKIHNVTMANIDYSDVFERAIEAKQVQQQAALQAKNKTAQVEEEARQKVIAAEAEAKVIKIRGEADAEATRVKGEALKENPNVVMLELAQKWNGIPPSTLVVGDEGKTLLTVGGNN